jgi:hypothetical protein
MSKRFVFVSLCAVLLAGCSSTQAGPQGLTGPAGPPGPVGATGPQGPAGAALARTVVVSPEGDPAASGTALRAAMDGITDADADHPYLLKIEPGVYDLGTSTLIMQPYVDVEGSGEGVTLLTATGPYGVNGADHSELRRLSVSSSGGNAIQLAIQVVGTDGFVVEHVTASVTSPAAGGFAIAVSGDATVRDSTLIATAPGGADAIALYGNAGGTSHVYNSVLSGETESMRGDPLFVSNSQIHGVASDATCVNSFNDAFVALGADCN